MLWPEPGDKGRFENSCRGRINDCRRREEAIQVVFGSPVSHAIWLIAIMGDGHAIRSQTWEKVSETETDKYMTSLMCGI